MPRKLLKRYLPKQDHLHEHKYLKMFGHRLTDPNLWHLNRRSVSGGTALGIFCAFLPMPMEMVPAALGAIIFRVNLPISILWVWVSNPLTWLPLYGPAYLLGAYLLGEPTVPLDSLTMEWAIQHLEALWLGCLIVGSVFSVLGYFIVRGIWRLHVVKSWQERRKRRKEKYRQTVESLFPPEEQ
ncbi:DUF2062 domain-containing protein [Pseudomonadota bacterium]